jgi:predicted metal-dependent phosphoesterase TrpH
VIDLHMHTTSSDGTLSPSELVSAVSNAGLRVFAVADHDTVDAVPEAIALGTAAGLTCVPAVEITAVHGGKDVHVLGYFIDAAHDGLRAFLAEGRRDRRRRAEVMCERLAGLGVPLDFDRLLASSGGLNSGKAIARPVVARALVEAGHVSSVQEAFDRFLAEGAPAYCPRVGASPEEVVGLIAGAGGLPVLAHPGPLRKDELIRPLVSAGLAALECFHSEHDADTTERYLAIARQYDLGVTGGSDFHGPGDRRAGAFGRVTLPQAHYDELLRRAQQPVRPR